MGGHRSAPGAGPAARRGMPAAAVGAGRMCRCYDASMRASALSPLGPQHHSPSSRDGYGDPVDGAIRRSIGYGLRAPSMLRAASSPFVLAIQRTARRLEPLLAPLCTRTSGRDLGALRATPARSEEHTSELQSRRDLVCRLLLEKK